MWRTPTSKRPTSRKANLPTPADASESKNSQVTTNANELAARSYPRTQTVFERHVDMTGLPLAIAITVLTVTELMRKYASAAVKNTPTPLRASLNGTVAERVGEMKSGGVLPPMAEYTKKVTPTVTTLSATLNAALMRGVRKYSCETSLAEPAAIAPQNPPRMIPTARWNTNAREPLNPDSLWCVLVISRRIPRKPKLKSAHASTAG